MEVPYWTELSYGDMAFYLTGHLNIPPSPPIIHGTTDGDVNIEYDFWTDPIIDRLVILSISDGIGMTGTSPTGLARIHLVLLSMHPMHGKMLVSTIFEHN